MTWLAFISIRRRTRWFCAWTRSLRFRLLIDPSPFFRCDPGFTASCEHNIYDRWFNTTTNLGERGTSVAYDHITDAGNPTAQPLGEQYWGFNNNEITDCQNHDTDDDGVVGILDYGSFLDVFGTTCAP